MTSPLDDDFLHPSGKNPTIGDIVLYTPRDVGIACPAIVVFVAYDGTLGLRVFTPERTVPKYVDHRRWNPDKIHGTWHWRTKDL